MRSTAAADRSQQIVPVVATGSEADVRTAVAAIDSRDFDVAVRLPTGDTVGNLDADRARPNARVRATATHELSDGRVILDQPVVRADGTAVISTLMSEQVLDAGVWRAWGVLAALALVLFLLSLVVADRLAGTLTRPMTDLAGTAARLGEGDLGARVEPAGPAEVRGVGVALNRLATRIGELLTGEREAVADLSHRLRTPVTVLRLDVESLPAGEHRQWLNADIDELTRQIDGLIHEARRPVRAGVGARCDARSVVAERVQFWRPFAEDQDRELDMALAPTPCPVRTTAADLEATLDALLGNVLAHTPEGAALEVALTTEPDGVVLLVIDDGGAGFSDHTVLARGASRSGSTGLGLDIARRTADAAGGDLRIGRSPSGGARVSLRLGPPI